MSKITIKLNEGLKKPNFVTNPYNIKGFVHMAAMCYNKHITLCIDPKVVWNTIVHQVYLLIVNNGELLRNKYVDFQNKETIHIYSESIDLSTIPLKFIKIIQSKIKDEEFSKWIFKKFSTSTDKDEQILSMMMMGCFKKYFNYSCSDCGLPEIQIYGNLKDWLLIKNSLSKIELDFADYLPHLHIKKWVIDLNLLIDEFINVFNNIINFTFWKDFIIGYHPTGSGSQPYFSGYCTILNRFFTVEKYNIQTKTKEIVLKETKNFSINFSDINDEYTSCIINYNGENYKISAGNLDCIYSKDNNSANISPNYYIKKVESN